MFQNWALAAQTKAKLEKFSSCRTELQAQMTVKELAMPNEVGHIRFATSNLATPACNIYQH